MKNYLKFVPSQIDWLFRELLNTKLVFTNEGLFYYNDVIFSGSCAIVNKTVFRPVNFIIFDNWFDFLIYYKQNDILVKSICKKVIIDLDDGNCCADGHIMIENRNPKGIIFKYTSVSVPFNTNVHSAIYSCFNL